MSTITYSVCALGGVLNTILGQIEILSGLGERVCGLGLLAEERL